MGMAWFAAMVVIAGCLSTTSMDEEPPLPTLMGVWRGTEMVEQDGMEIEATYILTFTKSRYIHVLREPTGDGYFTQVRSGTWSSTDEIVTKTRLRGRGGEEVVVQKEYSWGDQERNVLVMHPWRWDRELDYSIEYTREPAITRESISGTWRDRYHRDDDPEVDGEIIAGSEGVTIGAERCSIRLEEQEDVRNALNFIEVSGPCEVDLEELRVSFTVDRTDADNWLWPKVEGTTLTYAFAPSVDAASIHVSFYRSEQTRNRTTEKWELGNSEFPYGNYDLRMDRVDE
jgi:hypothetical protein